ncbi:hypothetical protein N7527_011712 [Penicillium freii]|nr:hypothetical protein N7527_011712 [Penicillium freii]
MKQKDELFRLTFHVIHPSIRKLIGNGHILQTGGQHHGSQSAPTIGGIKSIDRELCSEARFDWWHKASEMLSSWYRRWGDTYEVKTSPVLDMQRPLHKKDDCIQETFCIHLIGRTRTDSDLGPVQCHSG